MGIFFYVFEKSLKGYIPMAMFKYTSNTGTKKKNKKSKNNIETKELYNELKWQQQRQSPTPKLLSHRIIASHKCHFSAHQHRHHCHRNKERIIILTMLPEKVHNEHTLLNRDNIGLWCIFTSHYNTLESGREDTLCTLTSCCYWLGRRDDHEHVVVSLNNSHYTNRASFFDVPTNTGICKFQSRNSFSEFFYTNL